MSARAPSRVVGIDLGTTHTVVAQAPAQAGATPRIVPIPQLVAATEIAPRPMLPSCLYAPLPHETFEDIWGDGAWVAGELARRRGAEVPARFVGSAKSWLGYGAVDRTAAILPWGDEDGTPRISPLEASAKYLAHTRRACPDLVPSGSPTDSLVILTVPASFDEAARELTVEAARMAGLSVRLIEEPQAAFYDWLHREGDAGLEGILAGRDQALVLVCDVGGGTTDLSLIRVTRRPPPESLSIERIAVGNHLLLGGDNMDLALAHAAEPRLCGDEEALGPARFSELVLSCRQAKERLLSRGGPESVAISVAGAGAQLVGNARSTRIAREEAERIVLEGFFPRVTPGARVERRKSALVAFGLPYERDVAITRHIAAFLARHRDAADGQGPSALLLNGGVFRSDRIVERLCEVVGTFTSSPVKALANPEPDLAVALGAAAYGLATLGYGRRIGGGSARGYYVGVEAAVARSPDSASSAAPLLCVVPRGAREGTIYTVRDRPLKVVVGRQVRFELYASDDAPVHHTPGALATYDEDHFTRLPPLAAKLDGAGQGAGEIPVVLEGELSPVGTLELSLVEPSGSRRFRLAFQLRAAPPGPGDGQGTGPGTAAAIPRSAAVTAPATDRGFPRRRLEDALDLLDRAFGKSRTDVRGREAKDLLRELERVLGERSTWTLETLRTLFDALIASRKARRRSADHERVFWLLTGYCIRPGFGAARDAERIQLLFPLFEERLTFGDQARGWQQFWIAWRRAAAGLGEPEQSSLRDHLDPLLAPAEKPKRGKGFRLEAVAELIELVSSLERVAAPRRSALGEWILERTWTDRDPRLRAAVGRIGARVPTYASVHYVVPPRVADRWLDHLLRENWKENPASPAAAVQIARRTGDRARDVSESVRREVQRKLLAANAPETWVRAVVDITEVEATERAHFFGDELPVGLRLSTD